jgi:hypothetical protein
MDEATKREINDLHLMVQNWKKFWLTQYSTDGINEWIYEEFFEEITVYIVPYVGRLLDTNCIDEVTCGVFYDRLRGEIQDMRRLLRLPDSKESALEDD